MTEASQVARDASLRQQEKTAERDRAKAAKAYLLEARKRVEEALGLARGAAGEGRCARGAPTGGRRSATGTSERLDERDEPIATDPNALQVVSRVRLNTGAAGDVAELRGDGKAVVLIGTMRLVVAARTLTLLDRAPTLQRARPG